MEIVPSEDARKRPPKIDSKNKERKGILSPQKRQRSRFMTWEKIGIKSRGANLFPQALQ